MFRNYYFHHLFKITTEINNVKRVDQKRVSAVDVRGCFKVIADVIDMYRNKFDSNRNKFLIFFALSFVLTWFLSFIVYVRVC